MSETYKLSESGGGATASLLFRFIRLHLVLSILALPIFYFKVGFDKYYMAIAAITAFSFLFFAIKKEAERISFENGKITVKGKQFYVVPFKTTLDQTQVKYRFNKVSERKKSLLKRPPKLILFRDNVKWVEFFGGTAGWNKPKLGEIVKTLIAKGCYNWFEFNKKSRRKRKKS